MQGIAMGIVYKSMKSVWRRFFPDALHGYVFGGHNFFSRQLLAAKVRLERTASHNELYDEVYYRRQDRAMLVSASGIADSLVEHFSVDSVLDVGCGSGAVMAALRANGVRTIGLEYSQAAIKICHEKGLEVHEFDIEGAPPRDLGEFGLVLSTEVAEHLPEDCADRYIRLLAGYSSRWMVITAATPGQGGTDHVNEQPHSYWIEKFEQANARFCPELTETLRADWQQRSVDRHRASNVMVFELLKP
ncbi:class I SAM-dependent methyltransferase [Roseiconus nitratireducens]|nr:class I SAM-dependent methyltransferase [Roseiconus nitratireducens]